MKLFWFALILLAIWATKRYYSDAGADNLRWILGPTARLAGGTAGVSFVTEPGTGYLSRERLFLIEKSCAGLNFMIAAFAMVTLTFRRRVTSFSSSAFVLAGSVLIAFGRRDRQCSAHHDCLVADGPSARGVTTDPAQSHRVDGIIVYFAGLVLLHELVFRVQRSGGQLRSRV